ncbi:hypothetical protein [uncultured Pontibacter sp.]|uniref:hypothetical protein n=1 Tax=uncultured Pontibacter sp. TaxID=453356 RepID=UPI002613AE69|nr:hypothetical protein [uncultured Pontibacter sp.]
MREYFRYLCLAFAILLTSCSDSYKIDLDGIISNSTINTTGEFDGWKVEAFSFKDTIDLGEVEVKKHSILADGSTKFTGIKHIKIDHSSDISFFNVVEQDFISGANWNKGGLHTTGQDGIINLEYDLRNIRSQKEIDNYTTHYTKAYLGFSKDGQDYVYVCDFVCKVKLKLVQ